MLPISFSFDTYICMFSNRHLHRSTWVERTVYYCDTISLPKCDDHITRVERWRYRLDNMIIPVERQENIGSFASKRAVNNNFFIIKQNETTNHLLTLWSYLIYKIAWFASNYKNKSLMSSITYSICFSRNISYFFVVYCLSLTHITQGQCNKLCTC